ncbi:conserved protein of unknown function [Pseudomonas sp. JV551A1]|uniref:hypothetical protein n=1 Tax=Pseudomonas sp. JV551A1 TaxID=2078787 RepID=UPI00100C4B27|nr:hypothetical protein [Pseudomonas sp. JV551A1]SPO55682.1 conserved protein of unknown function [Pseudomonas sp. JV551A1]
MLQADTRFMLDTVEVDGVAGDFYQWALSNIRYPLIRGVLVEYLLSKYIRRHAPFIARPAINKLTWQDATVPAYRASLAEHNQTQKHGDFMDLQLHWGLHFELKSTMKGARSYISKTRFYDPIHLFNSTRSEFVCPFYIFCEMPEFPALIGKTLLFKGMRCYVIKGEDLEQLRYTPSKGVSYQTIFRSTRVVKCTIEELPHVLRDLVDARVTAVQGLLRPGWTMRPPAPGRSTMPLALETDGEVIAGYWNAETKGRESDMNAIWRDGACPTWRDWEAAGFHYAEAPPSQPRARKGCDTKATLSSR